VPHHNGNLYLVGENLTDLWIYDIKLEKGSIPTDWTPAPEDTENAINNVSNSLEPIRIRTTQVESGIKILQDKLLLTATKDDVTRVLDEKLQPIKNEVQQQNANIELLPNKLTEQVSQHIYETTISGLVKRLEAEESKRETLANQINDTVSIQQYQSGIQEAKEYADEQLEDVANNPGIKAGIQKANEEAQESLKEYVRAQDTLKQQESQAYIDGQISAEEQRAIEEARQKLAEAKRHAEDKANEAQRLSNSYTDSQIRDANRERDQILTRYDSQIQQNGREIALRTTKQEFNTTNRTLSNIMSEIVQNVTTGATIRFDDNGTAQSLNVGRDGIKLRGDKVDITVNRDFNVLVNDVANKADETNIINKLNLSREGLDINVNNIGIRGGNDVSYVDIRNDQIELSGEYTRTFRGDTQKDFVYTRIKDGLLRFRNNTRNRSLYYSDFGISTYVDGGPNESSGTLQFFDNTYSKNARGVTLNSVTGIVALRSDNNSIVIESSLTTNIESNNYSVYVRPFKQSRAGLNEFQFYVKDADSSSDTDGCILFGNLTDPNGVHGSGIRFSKSRTDNILYVTNPNGDIGTGDISVKMAEIREHIRTIGMLEIRQWSDSKAFNQIKVGAVNTTNSVVMASHSGGNAYYGVGGGSNEMRVTDNNGYNGGNTRYKSVRADTFYGKTASNSSEKYKTNIEPWDINASKLLEDTVFYEYNYKSDLEKGNKQKSHGIIIEREMPKFISRDGDSIDLYEFISTIGKALQEQIERNDQLEFKVENIYRILEEQLNEQTTS
ncbi:TPA: hypothetical protein LQO64_002427, partial [Staphylococcus pseudintermedius]|nr:hypothetical protein [Staphylococcus pseudintermedius]